MKKTFFEKFAKIADAEFNSIIFQTISANCLNTLVDTSAERIKAFVNAYVDNKCEMCKEMIKERSRIKKIGMVRKSNETE